MHRELYFCSRFETVHLNTPQGDLTPPHQGDLTSATGAAAGSTAWTAGSTWAGTAHKAWHKAHNGRNAFHIRSVKLCEFWFFFGCFFP